MPKYTIKYIPSSCLLIFKQIASNEAEYTFLCIGGGVIAPILTMAGPYIHHYKTLF